MNLRRAILSAVFGFAVPGVAVSCVCDSSIYADSPTTVREAVSESAAVFQGTVERIENGQEGPRAILKVKRQWKGRKADPISVGTLTEGCRFDFQTDEDYVVYALPDSDGYFVTACGRTRQASQAAFDLNVLNQIISASVAPASVDVHP